MDELVALVGAHRYPGRGIVVGRTLDGELFWLYWVTGRSQSSHERRALRLADRIVIESTRVDAGHDPLRHYTAMRWLADCVVVGNGSQVDVVADGLDRPFEPEPDPPIWTPRIYAVVGFDGTVAVRSVRRGADSGNEYLNWGGAPAAGEAVVVHTYASDGGDVISDAMARTATYDGALTDVEAVIWDALDPEFRVLVVSGAVPS